MRPLTTLVALSIAFSFCAATASAEVGLKALGVRAGITAKAKHEYFHQYEIFGQYGLPWEWRGKSGWGLGLLLDASAGALHGGKATGFIGTAGPGFSFDRGKRGFSAGIGPSLVIMNKRHYGTQDFAGRLQFLIWLGLNYRFDNGLGIGYRIQHMSNAGLYDSFNPGLDLHMAALSWNF